MYYLYFFNLNRKTELNYLRAKSRGINKIITTDSQIFKKYFLICEFVAKKSKQSFEELKLKRLNRQPQLLDLI